MTRDEEFIAALEIIRLLVEEHGTHNRNLAERFLAEHKHGKHAGGTSG